MIIDYSTSKSYYRGRQLLLFLLFILALYEFITAGFTVFAVICLMPIVAIVLIGGFRYKMSSFWLLIVVNFVVQWKSMILPPGIPVSLFNEMLEIILIAMAIIDVKEAEFNRLGNLMFLALIIWCCFCTLEVFNDTCGLGLNIGAWYQGVRMMAYQIIYAFLVFTLYITSPKILVRYLIIWGCFALFAVFWVWKQKYIGFTASEDRWIHGAGYSTHIIQGGTLIRYFSIYSDAANYGIGIASTAVAFIIFGITSKIKRLRNFFILTGLACLWGMFPSGTRTGIACIGIGFGSFLFLSKSTKIIIPFSIVFALSFSLLAFTTIGNSNQQIRRMRSAFSKDDASANQRTINQETMSKYMKEAPWGIGLGMYGEQIPPNNKYRLMATIAADSEYIFIWLRTGIIGISLFLVCNALMILGACWLVFFKIKNPSLRGIGAGLCCAMISQQLGGYGNMVLLQFPNCLTFYGGLTIVYILPHIENEWIVYEKSELAIEAERKRLKEEKKRAKRV